MEFAAEHLANGGDRDTLYKVPFPPIETIRKRDIFEVDSRASTHTGKYGFSD